jgi:hypothetical protein
MTDPMIASILAGDVAAVANGDVAALCAILSKGLLVNHKNLLKQAVDKRNYACVECILQNVKVELLSYEEIAIIASHMICGPVPDLAIFELLLDKIENQTSVMQYLNGILHISMWDVRFLDVFLRKIPIDRFIQAPCGLTHGILYMKSAVTSGTAAVVKRCLEDSRIDPACMDNLPLMEAVKKGDAKMVKLLAADPRVDPAVRDNWSIREASIRGNAEIVACLMQYRRVDPTARDNECLRWAVYSNHVDVVRALLTDRRVDPSVNNNCTIRWAMKEGHYDIVTQLLSDSRVDPSVADNEVMRTAVERGQDALVTFLLIDPRVDVSIVPSGPHASVSPELADLTDLF